VTRGTTQRAGETNAHASLLQSHSAACALQARAATLLADARALSRQLSRIIKSRTGETRKNSGTGRSKASATTATSASSKRKKTRGRALALTDSQVSEIANDCSVCRAIVAGAPAGPFYLRHGHGLHLTRERR
jgi:hypothetical protein